MERQIRSTDANAAATLTPQVSLAIAPDASATARGRLFVFLSGTGGAPDVYDRILRVGSLRGYHAIGLAYPDGLAVGQACRDSPDPECSSKMREEILTGQNLSPFVDINVPNSVVQRLTDLLTYLNRNFPLDGWGQYLSGGSVNWSLVSVGGHSQGSGHAAYLGKLYSLNGIAMFSGVADLNPAGNAPAAWLSRPNITPASRQYGFGHLRDPTVPFALQRASWHQIGIDAFGAVTSVDGASAPYGNSHQLSTNAEPQTPATEDRVYHSVPVVDNVTPLTAQGTPVFAPVWSYMLFP